MNSSAPVDPQSLPSTGRYCTHCRRVLGAIDQKNNGSWFRTCSICRTVERERARKKRASSPGASKMKRQRLDIDKENTDHSVDPRTAVLLPRPLRPLARQRSPLAPKQTYRGIVESDSPAYAAAKKEQIAIRRDHRVQRRQGEEIPATPTLTQLAERYPQSPQDSYHPGPNSTPIPSPWITGCRRRVTERVRRRYNKQQRLHQANPEHPDQEQSSQEQPDQEQSSQEQPD